MVDAVLLVDNNKELEGGNRANDNWIKTYFIFLMFCPNISHFYKVKSIDFSVTARYGPIHLIL